LKILVGARGVPSATARFAAFLPGHELLFAGPEEIRRLGTEADVVIPLMSRVDSLVIETGSFGLVQQFGVGLEGVDIEAATRAGVWVARVPSRDSGNAASVAEHVLMLMLMLSRRPLEARRALEAGRIGEPMGSALAGKSACIVGLGGIGTHVARRLHACEMRLQAVHEHPEREVPAELGIERIYPLADLRAAVADSDWVILCLNYDPSRLNLFGTAELQAMKPGAFLVNVARGGLLDPDALYGALRSGHLAGAGLDVFWEEPVDPAHPLFSQNVIATPHVAGVTDLSYRGIAEAVAENIRRYEAGQPPLHAANRPFSPRHSRR